MRVGRAYLPKDSVYPLMGLNSLDPSTLADPRFGVTCDNLSVQKGIVSKRRGYRVLGDQTDIPSDEPCLQLIDFETQAGSRVTVAVFLTDIFRYDSTGDEWISIAPMAAKIKFKYGSITGTPTVGQTITQATSGAIGTFLSDDGTYVYLSAVSGTFVATHDLSGTGPTVTITAHGTPSVEITPVAGNAITLTGDEDDGWDSAVGLDQHGKWLYLTNGKDAPIRWDGSMDNFMRITDDPEFNYPGFVTCKTLAVFKDTLVFGNLQTSSTEPQSVAWSDTVNFSEWVLGNAGVEILTDIDGPIRKVVMLGERLVIYAKDSITVATYIGGDAVYTFEQLIQNTQLLSRHSMVNLGAFHLYSSRENFHLFDGTRLVRPVGDRVQRQYRTDVLLSEAAKSHAFIDKIENQLYFTIPFIEGDNYTYVADYNVDALSDIRWTRYHYANRATSFGYFTRDSDVTYFSEDESLTYDDDAGTYFDNAQRAGFPVRVIGGDGAIYIDDDSDFDDAGQPIEAVWESIDFTVPGDYVSATARFIELEMELKGDKIDVDISTDQGQSYVSVAAGQALTDQWVKYKFPIDYNGTSLRVRLSNGYARSVFMMRFLRAWMRPGGPS